MLLVLVLLRADASVLLQQLKQRTNEAVGAKLRPTLG